jgi:DNA-binding GntR family transcriptional regulator
VLETRELLETYAVRRLAADPDLRSRAVTELRALLDAQRAAVATNDLASFSAADEAFHRTIVEAAGNRLLAAF